MRGAAMTKTEFKGAFKRLRLAGYRLPVFDGVTVEDVMDEWYQTFQACGVDEFVQAIDRVKQVKRDTFWPATGEVWAQVFEVRKARRIRLQAQETGGYWQMSDENAQEFLAMLREAKRRIMAKMAMPEGEPVQELPDHVLLEHEELDRAGEAS